MLVLVQVLLDVVALLVVLVGVVALLRARVSLFTDVLELLVVLLLMSLVSVFISQRRSAHTRK